jgi:hypothetical protein
MTDSNQRQDATNNQNLDHSTLDRELDAALAKFAAVEPRAGLEERVMANLGAERARAGEHSWWRWPALAALAAVIVLAASLAWRTGKPVQKITTQTPPAPVQADKHVGTQLANNSASSSIRPRDVGSGRRLKPRVISYPEVVAAASPKLDQFPSPHPLSEQEIILFRYITNYPEHAALIAQARTEELRQDSAEEMAEVASAGVENSQHWTK